MRSSRLTLVLMSVLTALFVLRVCAQLLQALFPVGWVPEFEAWQSGVLPYPVLLAVQLGIVGFMSLVLQRVRNGTIRARPWKYRVCLVFGSSYFAVMAFRWVAGLTFLADQAWFAESLPAFFHMVLASFILLLGLHIRRRKRNPKIFGYSAHG